VVNVIKYHKKRLYGNFRVRVSTILRELRRYKGADQIDGYFMAEHIHLGLRAQPKLSIALAIGFFKGKSAV
jgi:REP element-mobilizing transposase RayT